MDPFELMPNPRKMNSINHDAIIQEELPEEFKRIYEQDEIIKEFKTLTEYDKKKHDQVQ